MRRYNFLGKDDISSALNRLRNAFLAAKNGEEVEEIINGILTQDEKLKIGRRILIAEYIIAGMTVEEISKDLKVGRSTIVLVGNRMLSNPACFKLINKRKEKVEKEYENKKYREVGGSKLVFKKKVYTGFTRKDVQR